MTLESKPQPRLIAGSSGACGPDSAVPGESGSKGLESQLQPHNLSWRGWLLVGLMALPLAACGPSCDATSSSDPVGRYRQDGSFLTSGGYHVITVCDTTTGNLIYASGNGGVAVVPGGCR